jgi:predicted nucleic acid-binding protein
MAVVDASVLVEYLAAGEHAEPARRRILDEAGSLWAPHLVDAEVGHALRREVCLGELEPEAALEGLGFMTDLPLRRVPHDGLLSLAWELRDRVSFYDALYLSLAELLGQPLITFDARLAKASGLRAEVEVLG